LATSDLGAVVPGPLVAGAVIVGGIAVGCEPAGGGVGVGVGVGETTGLGEYVGVIDGFSVGDRVGVGGAASFRGAVMATLTDAVVVFGRLAALPVTLSCTDVMFDAVTGTVTCAWSCRGADCASTVPSVHAEVPSPLPQPKLKDGVPPADGVALRESPARRASPPVVQAVTVH
jgi:hypothetical protein